MLKAEPTDGLHALLCSGTATQNLNKPSQQQQQQQQQLTANGSGGSRQRQLWTDKVTRLALSPPGPKQAVEQQQQQQLAANGSGGSSGSGSFGHLDRVT